MFEVTEIYHVYGQGRRFRIRFISGLHVNSVFQDEVVTKIFLDNEVVLDVVEPVAYVLACIEKDCRRESGYA